MSLLRISFEEIYYSVYSASDVDRQKLLVDILDTMWKTMLAGRQARRVKGHDVNKSREGDVSQGGDMEEVDGDKESRRHLLPLAFTNEMLHVTLHLLKLMRLASL